MKARHYYFECMAALGLLCIAMVLGLMGSVVLFEFPLPFIQDIAAFLLKRSPVELNAIPFLGMAFICIFGAFWLMKD